MQATKPDALTLWTAFLDEIGRAWRYDDDKLWVYEEYTMIMLRPSAVRHFAKAIYCAGYQQAWEDTIPWGDYGIAAKVGKWGQLIGDTPKASCRDGLRGAHGLFAWMTNDADPFVLEEIKLATDEYGDVFLIVCGFARDWTGVPTTVQPWCSAIGYFDSVAEAFRHFFPVPADIAEMQALTTETGRRGYLFYGDFDPDSVSPVFFEVNPHLSLPPGDYLRLHYVMPFGLDRNAYWDAVKRVRERVC